MSERNIGRLFRHALSPGWLVGRAFRRDDLAAIESAVAAAERSHRGELRFVVEGALALAALWRGQSPRQRAVELFARLGVWDTEENSGVLIYVQLIDRRVEIVADRGIAARVPQAEWETICRAMEEAFRAHAWRQGALDAIVAAGRLLTSHFPSPTAANPNELPDRPLVL